MAIELSLIIKKMKSPFSISPEELSSLFEHENMHNSSSLSSINRLQGVFGLCDGLCTSISEGISSSDPPLSERKRIFGSDDSLSFEKKSLWHLAKSTLSDVIVQMLIAASVVSLIIGLCQDRSHGWIEGSVILLAVLIVVSITTINDSFYEKQLLNLNKNTETDRVIAYRDSLPLMLPVKDLVVGDLVRIDPDEIIPANCVLVKGSGLSVDQSTISGETVLVRKDAPRGGDMDCDPFLVSGSRVVDGGGFAIVCDVKPRSIIRRHSGKIHEEAHTPLQERLTHITQGFSKIGFFAGLTLTLILMGHSAYDAYNDKEREEGVSAIILGITILVIAIPEGMPLALTLRMVYCVLHMKDQSIFVRRLRACEVMASATSILLDKTGTLTQNKMRVTCSEFFGKEFYKLDRKQLELVSEVISRNTVAFVSREGKEIGNQTECAILSLLQKSGCDYYKHRDMNKQIAQYPFSSRTKKMITVYEEDSSAMVYCKGAAEVIVRDAEFYRDENGSTLPFDTEEKQQFLERIKSFASESLRMIGVSYKATNLNYIEEDLESGLIFLGFFGIEDPLRPESNNSVVKCQRSGVTLRMVTGDSLDIALKIARSCNIITGEEDESSFFAMEGSHFRTQVGGLITKTDSQGRTISLEVEDIKKFSKVASELKVLASCSSEDKLLLTIGLKQLGEVVAVVGDGSNDADALEWSDIGLAMVTGTSLAKECTDIIFLDDNIENVVNCINWGRNVHSSIRKFIQLQVTVNAVALIVSIVGAVTIKNSPLAAVQILWVNLIMDSMAALALATEPLSNMLDGNLPFTRTQPLVSQSMYSNIISQTVYQITLLLIVLYLGPRILDIDPGWGNEEWNEENGKHFTLIFHTFVVMQVFNEINCRKLSNSEWNVFEGVMDNRMFLGTFGFTLAVQFAFVQYGGETLKCASLNIEEHLMCLAIGAFGLFIGLIVRIIGYSVTRSHTKDLEEEPFLKEIFNL